MLAGTGSLAEDLRVTRPHVVILGAGASRAAFPHGDRAGIQLPLMHDLVDKVGIKPILARHGYPYLGGNFEELYSTLSESAGYEDLTKEVERAVFAYFSPMQLPEKPTLYDHLVLSLRGKDLIATFNWDPLLVQACVRNNPHAELPTVVFLHGNVAIGYCSEHRISGPFPSCCTICGTLYSPSRLLYPTTNKDYSTDSYVGGAWGILRQALEQAYVLTIFGYSGPASDAAARELMEEAWGDSAQRELEETEIIDIRGEDDLAKAWSSFICSHHYRVVSSYYDSIAASYPRRSCEAMWRQLMEIEYLEKTPLPRAASFSELRASLGPWLAAEAGDSARGQGDP